MTNQLTKPKTTITITMNQPTKHKKNITIMTNKSTEPQIIITIMMDQPLISKPVTYLYKKLELKTLLYSSQKYLITMHDQLSELVVPVEMNYEKSNTFSCLNDNVQSKPPKQ